MVPEGELGHDHHCFEADLLEANIIRIFPNIDYLMRIMDIQLHF